MKPRRRIERRCTGGRLASGADGVRAALPAYRSAIVLVLVAHHEVVRELLRLRRREDAEMGRTERIERALAGQADVRHPLPNERRARREVVRIAIPVLRRHGREERPVLRRDVDEVGVRVPERQVLRRPGRLPAVQLREEGRARRSELDADRTVRVEATERRQREVVQRRGRAIDPDVRPS